MCEPKKETVIGPVEAGESSGSPPEIKAPPEPKVPEPPGAPGK